ncbi:hypothetical protein FNV43_RR16888 [Rhamnella rubrinervis]|uniref:rRNA methyltransferase 1, mitochondrial n=1 Tax=Rhamnella rubrinervis TaxID=2594499 RepID=A0A8K0MDT9_9ROSA|nr:hypothetical protein FNV43_RR16888 [Rhamnella rubrinervis]
MCTSLAKSQVFPLAIRSPTPRCCKQFCASKSQSLPIGSPSKPSLNPSWVRFTIPAYGFGQKTYGNSCLVKALSVSTDSHCRILKTSSLGKSRNMSTGFRLKPVTNFWPLVRVRDFSNSTVEKVSGQSTVVRAGKPLPWLASNKAKAKEAKWLEKAPASQNSSSSWEESAKRLEKVSTKTSWEESVKRLDRDSSKSFREEYAKRLGEEKILRSGRNIDKRSGPSVMRSRESRNEMTGMIKGDQSNYIDRDKRFEEETVEGEEEEETEVIDDPRWSNIKRRFRGMVDVKDESAKPEFQRWNKQENWGRRTWKEATESTVPKMVGEGVYGVGPVLAALSAGRREFYALYIQEGLDLSNNNRKKKDKKGIEKVLRRAEKMGISIKKLSKHDLNMVTDNRPHQGLVLDASPLEMVKIMELDPVSVEEDKGSLWVALDEVTDPQNLGAIIRSAYFFGASGVVLCAKNSAPLSGVVSKASAGSLELMELRYCKNMMQFLTSSADNGWRVLGGSVSPKSIPLNEVAPGAPTILALGSEGTGLRPLVERSCTQLIRIPGNIPIDVIADGSEQVETAEGNSRSAEEFQSFLAVESLNVSVAAGVLLHHLIGEKYKNDIGMVDKETNALG